MEREEKNMTTTFDDGHSELLMKLQKEQLRKLEQKRRKRIIRLIAFIILIPVVAVGGLIFYYSICNQYLDKSAFGAFFDFTEGDDMIADEKNFAVEDELFHYAVMGKTTAIAPEFYQYACDFYGVGSMEEVSLINTIPESESREASSDKGYGKVDRMKIVVPFFEKITGKTIVPTEVYVRWLIPGENGTEKAYLVFRLTDENIWKIVPITLEEADSMIEETKK